MRWKNPACLKCKISPMTSISYLGIKGNIFPGCPAARTDCRKAAHAARLPMLPGCPGCRINILNHYDNIITITYQFTMLMILITYKHTMLMLLQK